MYAGLEGRATRVEPGLRILARLVSALERDHLDLVYAVLVAIAVRNRRVPRCIAGGDGVIEPDEIDTGSTPGPTGLHAGVAQTAALVLVQLEVLAGLCLADLEVSLRRRPARHGIDRRIGWSARLRAGLEPGPAGNELVLHGVPRVVTTHEGRHLRIVDAVVALDGPGRECRFAVVDVDVALSVARGDGRREPGVDHALVARVPTYVDARVVAIEAVVLFLQHGVLARLNRFDVLPFGSNDTLSSTGSCRRCEDGRSDQCGQYGNAVHPTHDHSPCLEPPPMGGAAASGPMPTLGPTSICSNDISSGSPPESQLGLPDGPRIRRVVGWTSLVSRGRPRSGSRGRPEVVGRSSGRRTCPRGRSVASTEDCRSSWPE